MLGGGVEAAVADAVVRLGGALGVAVVAEGVESAEVAESLTSLGCRFAQGYFFGRPVPVGEIAARLAGPQTSGAAA
jgi:EAL domain-containing protein (putative c-di-GMP-specific phosphodiesterase class I)